MLNFDFLGKGMEIVSPSHSVYDFSKKNVSFYALLTDQISLPDCLFFLRYWSICVLQLFVNQVGDVINFEINLIFLIKSFFCIIEKSRQKFKFLENKKSF